MISIPLRWLQWSLLLVLLILAACNQTDPPVEQVVEEVVEEPDEVAETDVEDTPTPVPTFTPTSPPPTATPTKAPPTPTATLVVTATLTPIPSPTPVVHIVEEFDTLLGIAIDYGVTVEALSKVNGVGEEEFLQLGQKIIIPNAGDLEAIESGAIVGSGAVEASTSNAEPPVPVQIDLPPPPKITHAPNINPLTGLKVDDPDILTRRPLMVRIGNDSAARQSQVGVGQADIVYEEITEWWITRLTAIYLSEMPDTVGPVRSARLINVQLVPQYQGALAHSGGSDGVRWEISQTPITNLDEYFNPAPYFYRENEGWQTRLAIDAEAARDYLVDKELEAEVDQAGFPFTDEPNGGEPAEDIYIPYPRSTSFTEWHYDSDSGKYLRWVTGEPLIDVADGEQIGVDNVIIYFADHQDTDIVEDSQGATSVRVLVNGTGPAWMFRDGVLTKGTWQTDGTQTPFFRDENEEPYALKPGTTWISVVPYYYTIGLNSADEATSRP